MEAKRSQNIRQMLLLLWLTSLCVHIHSINVSSDSIPLVVLRPQTRKLKSCFQNVNIGERKAAQSCGQNIYYPEIETVHQNGKICFTDTKQNYFNKGNTTTRNSTISVRGCQILDVANTSCTWLEQDYEKLDLKDRLLLAVMLHCKNTTTKQGEQELCLIMTASRNLSDGDGDVGKFSCLFLHSNVQPDMSNPKSKERSFLDYMKEYMIPVLAVLGGVLVIIMAFLTNRVRKRHMSSIRDEDSETESANFGQEDGLYHEPNHTYIDIDSEECRPENYAYAYGHFEPSTSRNNVANASESGKKHDYMNITQIPDRKNNDEAVGCVNMDAKTSESGKKHDYINITQIPDSRNDDEAMDYINEDTDSDYMEMKSSYQTLDRSSMVDDNAMYQGLVKQKDRVRPKVAPKPNFLCRVEERELSYVKVL